MGKDMESGPSVGGFDAQKAHSSGVDWQEPAVTARNGAAVATVWKFQ